jgi:serine protease Do
MMRRLSQRIAAFALVVVIAAAGTSGAAGQKSDIKWPTERRTEPADAAELKALQARVKEVVDESTKSTVAVLIGFGAGSGVIVNEDGLVLTAAHVITGEDLFGPKGTYKSGKSCKIVLPDGKRVNGKTLGVNTDNDVGMVQITDEGPNNGKWPASPVAKSAGLRKGQWVVSLGHPGGPKDGRPPVARLGRIENNTSDIVRSNCTLVGGDSGGPLFDLDGKVIGIHSRIGLTLAQNIHVPMEMFQEQWDALVSGEVFPKKQSGAFLGVVFPDDEEDDAWVTEEVDAETPAGKGGLKAGDTITKFNSETVKSVKRFRELIKDKKPGDVVKLKIRRGSAIMDLSVTLGKKG